MYSLGAGVACFEISLVHDKYALVRISDNDCNGSGYNINPKSLTCPHVQIWRYFYYHEAFDQLEITNKQK